MSVDNRSLAARLDGLIRLDVCNGCTQCSLRCAAGTRASREEWGAIRDYVARMSASEREVFEQKLRQSKQQALGDGIEVTLCRFLDRETHFCTIYPVRPLVCRLMGHVEWLPCPIHKVEHPMPRPAALEILEAYAQTERRSFEEWEQLAPLLEVRLGET